MYRLNTKIRSTVLCLSGFELYSRWVPLRNMWSIKAHLTVLKLSESINRLLLRLTYMKLNLPKKSLPRKSETDR